MTSTGRFAGDTRSPSCSCSAVTTEGPESPGVETGGPSAPLNRVGPADDRTSHVWPEPTSRLRHHHSAPIGGHEHPFTFLLAPSRYPERVYRPAQSHTWTSHPSPSDYSFHPLTATALDFFSQLSGRKRAVSGFSMNLQVKSPLEERPEHRPFHLSAGRFPLGLRGEIVRFAIEPGRPTKNIKQALTQRLAVKCTVGSRPGEIL